MRNGLTLKHAVIRFRGMAVGKTPGVKPGSTLVQGLAGWQQPEA
jgi:hypothetical protein